MGESSRGFIAFLAPPLSTSTLAFVALAHLWKANTTFDELVPTKANFTGLFLLKNTKEGDSLLRRERNGAR